MRRLPEIRRKAFAPGEEQLCHLEVAHERAHDEHREDAIELLNHDFTRLARIDQIVVVELIDDRNGAFSGAVEREE